jgi:spectinomycin phosphotransferase
MLEKPDLKDDTVLACLQDAYGLHVDTIAFLPLGADPNTAVYRAEADNTRPYFVKVRRGDFLAASVAVPKFLSDLGMKQVIPPLPTQTGDLWAKLGPYHVILYPFVEGYNGFDVPLSAQQRIAFGQALKAFHAAAIPAELTWRVPREALAPRWRDSVRSFVNQSELVRHHDPVGKELAAFLQAQRQVIVELVRRTEQLARILQVQLSDFILCHGDIHGWNLLLDNNGALYIVDWDTLIFAPKERDLMFVGSGLGGRGHTLEEEVSLFYQGYGQTQVNPVAIAYYRYERIVEDIALFCEQILFSDDGEADRHQALTYLQSNFGSNGTIDVAYQLDTTGLGGVP